MQPPVLDDNIIQIDGKEYRCRPVMMVFYLVEKATAPETPNAAHGLLEAMKAGMHFYHSDEEIMELMGHLSLPEVIHFLTPPPPEPGHGLDQEFDDETNFLEGAFLTDEMLTSPPLGDNESPSRESTAGSRRRNSGASRGRNGKPTATNTSRS